LFTHDTDTIPNTDRIYRLTLDENSITELILLYEGTTLDFQKGVTDLTKEGLIDAIPYYETELIQKVYWIDGIN
jgi:hypothetical protein